MKFLDLLYSRYANPMELVGGMIRTKRLLEFVQTLIQTHNEDIREKTLWEFYLHRVFDESYQDFKNSLPEEAYIPSEAELAETISRSADMLRDFAPE